MSSVTSTINLKTYTAKNDWSKIINQYKIIKTLSKGSFSSVLLCFHEENKKLYALKCMNKQELNRKRVGKDQTDYDRIIVEMKVLKQLEHPKVSEKWLDEGKKINKKIINTRIVIIKSDL